MTINGVLERGYAAQRAPDLVLELDDLLADAYGLRLSAPLELRQLLGDLPDLDLGRGDVAIDVRRGAVMDALDDALDLIALLLDGYEVLLDVRLEARLQAVELHEVLVEVAHEVLQLPLDLRDLGVELFRGDERLDGRVDAQVLPERLHGADMPLGLGHPWEEVLDEVRLALELRDLRRQLDDACLELVDACGHTHLQRRRALPHVVHALEHEEAKRVD